MIPGLLGVVAMALPPTPAASLRQFLLGSWSVARTLEYSRGGATGPCRFQGKATFRPALYFAETEDEALAFSSCSPLLYSETGSLFLPNGDS
ncbi:hypothetical protein T484DRAFT_1789863 [Baffinella frigidus]|nr:hypothetical protein T484DRAFT_1789863 [Cryptophyta sp. CCMP2293]